MKPDQHIRELTPDELRRLAPLAKTTYENLRHYAAGRRQMSSSTAIAVERGAARIGLSLPRELHAAACAKCEFARACRAAKRDPK